MAAIGGPPWHTHADHASGRVPSVGDRVDWVDGAGHDVTGTVARAADGLAVVWDSGRCTAIPDDATIRKG